MKEKVIEYILDTGISTADVADAIGKRGLLSVARPLVTGLRCVGPGYCIHACGDSNWQIHNLARNVPEGAIVFVSVYGCGNKAVLGDLVTSYLLHRKRATAVVVDGNVRDAHCIIKNKYPVWSKGVSPIGVGHDPVRLEGNDKEELNKLVERINRSVLVCDDSGVVMVEDFDGILERLNAIHQREIDWHRQLDEGVDTFDFVCLNN
jgi:4-hydroxy-4-methyl-2-oxoglutarate aldolase